MLAGRAGPARFVCVLYMVLCAKERITGCCAGTGRAGARRTRKREKWMGWPGPYCKSYIQQPQPERRRRHNGAISRPRCLRLTHCHSSAHDH